MGLDTVEIVLRAEELYSISISDVAISSVRTVGDFYQVICRELRLMPLPVPVTPLRLPKITAFEKRLKFFAKAKSLPPPPEVLPWKPQGVWDCLVAIFVDQMNLTPEEVVHDADINRDLRID